MCDSLGIGADDSSSRELACSRIVSTQDQSIVELTVALVSE